MNVARHDAYFALAGTDNARTVWTNQTSGFVFQIFPDLHHVERGYTFGDTYNHADAGIGSFHDRIRRKSRRHVDHRRIGARFFDRVGDSVEYRNTFVGRATFARRHATDYVGSILNHLLSMERAFLAGNSLDDKARVLINKNAQEVLPRN